MSTEQSRSKGRLPKSKAYYQRTPRIDGVEEKLVALPTETWENLRQKGFHVPRGNFSPWFFTKNKLPLEALRELPHEAAKKAVMILLKALMPKTDSVVLKGFSEQAYDKRDAEILLDIADLFDATEQAKGYEEAEKKEPVMQGEEGIGVIAED